MKMGVLAGLSGLRHHASSSFLGSRVSMHQYTRLSERTRAEDAVEQAQHARADQGRRCCHETTSACSCFAVSAVLSSTSTCDVGSIGSEIAQSSKNASEMTEDVMDTSISMNISFEGNSAIFSRAAASESL